MIILTGWNHQPILFSKRDFFPTISGLWQLHHVLRKQRFFIQETACIWHAHVPHKLCTMYRWVRQLYPTAEKVAHSFGSLCPDPSFLNFHLQLYINSTSTETAWLTQNKDLSGSFGPQVNSAFFGIQTTYTFPPSSPNGRSSPTGWYYSTEEGHFCQKTFSSTNSFVRLLD